MDRLRFTTFAAVTLGFLSAHAAVAQTAANIIPVAGNGQIVCETCTTAKFFQPLVVRVTDANGQPVIGRSVTWNLISSQGPLPFFADTTITDGNGYSNNFFSQSPQGGSLGYPYLQSVVRANIDGVSVDFTETQGLTDNNNHQLQFIAARLDSPALGIPVQGTAGATSSTQVKVHVDAFGLAVSRASVRILNAGDPKTTASASCATGAGADIGSVLTDSNGDAVCNMVFGPISGNSSITVLVGGIDPAVAPDYYPGLTGPTGYFQSGVVPITITAGVPGMMVVVGGNNQNVNPGQSTSPLQVKVTDSTGVNPIPGQTVVWSVTPTGAATFNPTTSTSDSQGLASTVAIVSPSAVGPITITGRLSSNSSISANFSISANVRLTGLQAISGDQQTAPAGQPFSQPLVVQVNGSNGQPIPGYPVSFSISGPGTLSATSASTNASGRAQVTVTAGSTAGAVRVTAAAGGFSQSFSLTVIPPGPSLTQGSFLNGADFQVGSLSPCSIATVVAQGIAPTVQGVVVPGNLVGALPYTLAGVRISVANSQAPIFNVANVNNRQQATFEVPCDVTPGSSVPVTVNVSGGNATISIPILPASPGVFQTVMSDNVSRVVAVRPDGSFVSLENPARRGEIIRAFVTGLGPVNPPVGTNSVAVSGTDSNVTGQVIVGVANAGTRLVSAKLAQNLVGVSEVAFQVPDDAPAGNDIVFSVGVNATGDTQTRFSAGTKIPIL